MVAAAHDYDEKQRRDTLEGIQSSTPSLSPGAGLSDDDVILLHRFHDPKVCNRLCNRLSEAGIRSSKRSESQRLCVYVMRNDRTTAFEILERAAASDPDSRPKGIRRSHDAMILLAGFGLCIATFAALMGYWRYAAAVAATIFAAVVVLRRLRKNILWSGNTRFSVMEILILTAMAGVMVVIWQWAI